MQFEPNGIYHLYNRGNQKTKVFFEPRNYLFFLEKARKHIIPSADILAYCLMPNHFHFMIRVKEEAEKNVLNKNIGILLRSYTRVVNIQEGFWDHYFNLTQKLKELMK